MNRTVDPSSDDIRRMGPRELESVLELLAGVHDQSGTPVSDPGDARASRQSVPEPDLKASYRTLVEQLPAVVFMAFLDRAFSEAYVSPHIESILGFTQEEWLGDPIRWYRQIHPDDKGRVSYDAAQLFLWGEPLRTDYRVLARDGRVVSFRCEAKLVRAADGHPWFIHGIGYDVTDLKRAEEALRHAHDELEIRVRERTAELAAANRALEEEVAERKRAEALISRLSHQRELILNSAGEGVFGLDLTRTITFTNPAAARLLGETVESLVGRAFHAVAHSPGLDAAGPSEEACPSCATILEETRSHGNEDTFFRHDGGALPVEYTSTPIREGGMTAGAVVMFKDIGERKQLEAQLLQAQKMEAVGRLAGGVAHDFNNLLTVIGGYSEFMLRKLASSDPIFESVSEVAQAAKRAGDLTRQLLAFSRRQVIRPEVLDLNLVVAGTQAMLGRLIGEDFDLRIIASASRASVRVDRSQIEQVIVNLAVNGRDAMPRGGTLTIETTAIELDAAAAREYVGLDAGPFVMVAVSDTGAGMDQETLSHIFEPFFTTKEVGRGTGLGLAIVYGIVTQNGGGITVTSTVGRGTAFRIYLPVVPDGEPRSTGGKATNSSHTGGSETILLVEDEEGVRRLARTVLESHGYTVLEASDGYEALRACDRFEGEIHLLLTDVVMPTMSGVEVAERVASRRPATSVLFMSGYAEEKLVHHGVLDGDLDLVEKPFTPESLAQRVRSALDSRPS
jgi:two-component system cell cycle sensor histidine kinase/response regulator CckA